MEIISFIILFVIVCNIVLLFLPQNGIMITKKHPNLYQKDVLMTSNIVEQSWNISWGGSAAETGYDVVIDSNGTIYCVGSTKSFGAGGSDLDVIKLYSNGILVLNTTWGYSTDEDGTGMAIDPNGAIICGGNIGNMITDIGVVKFHPNMTQIWNATWGGPGTDRCYGIEVNSNSSIYCAGYKDYPSSYDVLLVKFFSNGTEAWNCTWGGDASEIAWGIGVDKNDSIYCTGWTSSFGAVSNDVFLVKFHPNGTRAWNITWGGSGSEEGWDVVVGNDDSIYCVGSTNSFGAGLSDLLLLKFYQNGTLAWNVTWGGSQDDTGHGLTIDANGSIYCIGETRSFGAGGLDISLIKFNPNGTLAWNITWGGIANEYGMKIEVDKNNSIYCVGFRDDVKDDLVLIRFSSNQIPIIPPLPTPPIPPYNPIPANGATDINTSPILSVFVSDPGGDMMNVSFHNAIDDNLIGIIINIPSGVRVTIQWFGLLEDTLYSWYAIADDGMKASISSTWSFTTSSSKTIPGYNFNICTFSIIALVSLIITKYINKNPKIMLISF